MTFANEDELAIHTVGAAAYRILRDILAKRGQDDLENLMRAGMYYCALDLVHGRLSEKQVDNLRADVRIYKCIFAIEQEIKNRGRLYTGLIPLSQVGQYVV
jgi:hypothetical protein